jgi:enoyl-CoA hydratase/carnithine racemase
LKPLEEVLRERWTKPTENHVYIDYQVADRIATITLNRPEAANAQNTELLDELDAAWTLAADDSEVAVIVLRAAGKHFSAGHDMRGGRSRWSSSTSTRVAGIWSTRCDGATCPSLRSQRSRADASRPG